MESVKLLRAAASSTRRRVDDLTSSRLRRQCTVGERGENGSESGNRRWQMSVEDRVVVLCYEK